MFDPAALGTLIIGLNADRNDPREPRLRRPVAAKRTIAVRAALASGLRRAAALLDGPAVSEVANS